MDELFVVDYVLKIFEVLLVMFGVVSVMGVVVDIFLLIFFSMLSFDILVNNGADFGNVVFSGSSSLVGVGGNGGKGVNWKVGFGKG